MIPYVLFIIVNKYLLPNLSTQWNYHDGNPGPTVRNHALTINDCIYYSSSHKSHFPDGENGITEYNISMNKITNRTHYPEDKDSITPCRQVCCKYNDQIYIIDGEHGEISVFDPVEKTFTKKCDMAKIGMYPNAVMLHDQIHIFNGEEDANHYYIYDINKNEINTFPERDGPVKVNNSSVIEYKNRIIKVGGFNKHSGHKSNKFAISEEIEYIKERTQAPRWIDKPEWKLPLPLFAFGLVSYKHYLIGLGGVANNWYTSGSGEDKRTGFMNAIFVLDMEDNDGTGWKEIDIECPVKSKYIACITNDNFVHIFTESNKWPNWIERERMHCSIHVSTLLGDQYNF